MLTGSFFSRLFLLYHPLTKREQTGKRIIFLGHQLPASLVADHVLAACALGSGCGVVIEGLVERAFPYTGLGNVDGLLEVSVPLFLPTCSASADQRPLNRPGFIAGVCNPAFSEKTTWWDVLCDISTGKITVSKDILFPSSNIHSVSPPPSISGSSISPDGVSELGVSLDGVSIVSGAAAGNTGAGTGGNYDLVFIEEVIFYFHFSIFLLHIDRFHLKKHRSRTPFKLTTENPLFDPE